MAKTKAGANGVANRVADALPAAGPVVAAPPDKPIVIPRPNVIRLRVRVRGISPLAVCRFSEKAREEMEDAMTGKARNRKAPKDFAAEFEAARWRSVEGWDGVNAPGIRAAMIDAARGVDGVTMTALKQAIFVEADGRSADGTPLVRIEGEARPWTAPCRTTTGVTYLRCRPMYDPWAMVVRLRVNGHILSADAAVNLLAQSGQWCGLGEWRPTAKKNLTGSFGLFEIADDAAG